MQLHARVAGAAPTRPCRALVGGFGHPGRRDLNFGERFIRYAETLEWPEGVVVEDLSYAAHLVLHRLQELRPAQLVLIGAVVRGVDAPGTVRRYRLTGATPAPEEVHAGLTQGLGGEAGLDHVLAVVRHWGFLPADTVVVEVEAADTSFGMGFSEEVGAATDRLVEVVLEELAKGGAEPTGGPVALPGIEQLFEYADAHRQVRAQEVLSDRLPSVEGFDIAARFAPASRVVGTSGNWYDAILLGDGGVGLVVGDVPGRGVSAASTAARLRTAVRALALVEGHRPARMIGHLDRLADSTGVGRHATLVYACVRSGGALLASAGHCRPLLVSDGGAAELAEEGWSAPLCGRAGGPRSEAAFALGPGSSLLLFTRGLVESAPTAAAGGRERLRRASANGPREVEALCDHVLDVCLTDSPREDATLLVVRAT